MKRSLTLLVLLTLVSIKLKAQNEVLFKIKYLPNHTYLSAITMNMNMEMNYGGDSTEVNKIKASGMKLPMIMQMETPMNLELKTDAYNAANEIPFTLSLKMDPKMIMGGKAIPIPGGQTQTMSGKLSADGKMDVESLTGKVMTDSLKKQLMQTIKTVQANIEFPDKQMKVGDTFTQDLPMNFPIPGFSDKTTIKINYKLISIANGKANFDMDFVMNMDMSGGKMGINIQGTGDGKLVYDIATNYPESMHENMNMTYSIKMPQKNVSMNGNMKMLMDQQTTVK